MVDSLSRNLLLVALRKRGWSISREKTDVWLKSGEYYLLISMRTWKLYVQQGKDLILVEEKSYGRRQSQEVKRAVDKDKKERRRCSTMK
jgi:hypothetical protein